MEINSARRMGAWLHPYLGDNSLELVFGHITDMVLQVGKEMVDGL